MKKKSEGFRKADKYSFKIKIKRADIDEEILKQNYQILLNILINNFGILHTGSSQNGGNKDACSNIHEG